MKTPAKPHMSDVQIEYNHLYKEFDDIYHDAALNASLSDSAFDILYGIFELGDGCLQRDICRTSCIPKQTINSAIRKMEANGWIELHRKADPAREDLSGHSGRKQRFVRTVTGGMGSADPVPSEICSCTAQ